MSDINRRLKKAEKALNIGSEKEKRIVGIVWFAGEELPPDEDHGDYILRYVSFEDVCNRGK